MKKALFFGLLITVSMSLMSTGCSSDDDDNQDDTNQSIEQIENSITSGTWHVSSFVDSGDNETDDFNGYSFTFETNGILTAQSNTTTLAGTWSITHSNSNDDNSGNYDLDFNIFFPVDASNDFEDLNDDWDLNTSTPAMLSLIDISGGNGGTDTLIFEKN